MNTERKRDAGKMKLLKDRFDAFRGRQAARVSSQTKSEKEPVRRSEGRERVLRRVR